MGKKTKKGRKAVHSGRTGRKGPAPIYEGKVQMTREGYIFVSVEGQDDDIYVKAAKTRNALDGDIVKVAVTKDLPARASSRAGQRGFGQEGPRKREGEVVEIVRRSGKSFVGIFHTVGAQAWVLMQAKNMPYDIEVDAEQAAGLGAKRGMKVAAVVDTWGRRDYAPKGHLSEVLGFPGENNTEMHAILAEFNLPWRFEKEVEDAADAISEKIGKAELKGRTDFRNTLTFTIDPSDAKDFDDALSFKPLPNGNYEVGVHIADVSWYVKPGTPVDKEARERGTSVYLVDRTVPMLPEKLCNKLCSLRPKEDKLTFSVVWEISPKAEIKSRWIGRTIINSDFRLDYEQAQDIIEKKNTDNELLDNSILVLNNLAHKLKERRMKMGAVDFDRPEIKVIVDEKGKPIDVVQKVSKESNWLIEEFMLLANRTVAEFVATDGRMNGVAAKNAKTFVYRVHDEPNTEKLEGLRDFAKGFGYRMEDELAGRSAARALNRLMDESKGTPEEAAFKEIALRSMAKAKYSTDNIGHYGLAFDFYTHFTSPIRRYPDTMVHRLLSAYLAGGESANKGYYEGECVHASEREVVAADAERASVKYKLAEYMQSRIGQEFSGHVSGITEWGMYVELDGTHVEGMIALREMRSDWFEFDEKRYRLVGRHSRKIYRLGDPVRIRVKGAEPEQRQIDFELAE